jgi:glycosyltransferase involved in cell wall biosynthesis
MILGFLRAALYDKLSLSSKLVVKELLCYLKGSAYELPSGRCVLVLDERIPTPDRDAGSLRMMRILSILRTKFDVVFIPFTPNRQIESALTAIGIRVADVGQYKRFLRSERVTAAVVSRPSMAELFTPRIREMNPSARVIFDTVDVHFIRLERESALTGNPEAGAEAKIYRETETRLTRAVDVIWCASIEDERLLRESVDECDSVVIPTLHELHEAGPGFDRRDGLLFVGSFAHRPNADAVQYFLDEIFPKIQSENPQIKMRIAGADPPKSIVDRASESIEVLGFVPDLEPLLKRTRLFVAPLRYGGAGTKGKVGEALSHGIPVVTTSIGAEGFGLTSGEDALIADDPTEFAMAVLRAYSNKSLWQRLSENGRARIAADFTPAAVANKVLASVDPASQT